MENYESENFKVDVSQFPLVYMQSKPFQPTAEEVNLYIEYLDALHTQSEPFVVLIEFPHKFVMLKAEHRIKIGNWMKENKEKMATCKATAFVTSNVLHKIVMQGIFLIQPVINEYKVFDGKEKAKEWLLQKMIENNISLSNTEL